MTGDAARDVFREAMREQREAWQSLSEPRPEEVPEPVSGDFLVTLAELELSGEDAVIDFYRFVRDTALRVTPHGAAGGGPGPVAAFLTAVAECLKSGGPVRLRPGGMTFEDMRSATRILRIAAERAGMDESPRHVRIAARQLSAAWEAFSGAVPDPRSPRERRLAWGDQRGWIET